MIRQITIITCSILLSIGGLYAQQENSSSKFDSKKLIFGGDIGFSISNSYWTVGGSPQIGYKLTDKFHIGAGIGYRFGKSDRDYYTLTSSETGEDGNYGWETQKYKYRENSASFNLFARYYPWKKLIISVKPEIMHTWYSATMGEEKYSANKFVPAIVVGGGVHLKPVILQLNYELIQNKYSPYSDNIFLSIGFMF